MSATYDASNGKLVISAQALFAGGTFYTSKLTVSGEGNATYTLTSPNVSAATSSSVTVALNAADQAKVALILNKNGTASTGGTTYNLAAATGWFYSSSAPSDLTGNAITVSNVPAPAITSATYDASTGALVVTGTGFLSAAGSANDIVANTFTFTGNGGATYTLTDTANVDVTSGTSFTLTLSATDQAGVAAILNNNGTAAGDGTTYNLAAAEDWNAGADAGVTIADPTGNGITVSNAVAASVTSVSVPANGTYGVGQTLSFTVNFSTNVVVTTSGGTPQIAVTLNSGTVYAAYVSGSGTTALVFDYTVTAGDADSDGIGVGALSTNGGMIADGSGVDALLTLNSVGSTASVFVNTTPTVTGVSPASGPSTGGTSVTITGTNFTGATAVKFGAANATSFSITSSTAITATAPAGTTGTVDITVVAPGGTSATGAADQFTYANTAPVAGFGTALTLEASRSEGVQMADNAAYGFGVASFTIEAWVKRPANNASFYTVVGKQDGSGGSGFYLRFNGDSLSFAAGSSSNADVVTSSHTITDGAWHHVAAVRDASANTVSIYVDGVLDSTAAYTTAYSATSTAPLGLGFKPNYGEYFEGSIDEVRLWNTARTSAQIRDFMNTPLAGTESGLVGYWNFEEGTGTSVADRSPTANAGAIQNAGGATEWTTGNISYAVSATEDTSLSLRLGGSDYDTQSAATAVLTAVPSHGTLYQTNDGTTAGASLSNGSALTDTGGNPCRVIYTPDANYNGADSFTYKVNDGTSDSANTVTVNLTIAAVNDAPVVATTGGSASFTAASSGSATPVAIDSGISVSDVDNTTLANATVAITGNLQTAEDALAFTNSNATTYGNISASYNSATGILTLSSSGATATVAQWQAALAAVTYTDTSNSPNTATRTISFTVNDGAADSAAASRTVSVAPVAPAAPTIGTATAGDAQASVTFTAPTANGGATITGYTVTSSPGGFTGTGTSSPITVTGLTNGTAYTFSVTATNSAGTSAASAASNAVTPQAPQTITFNNPGTQNFGTTPTLTASATSGLTVTFTSLTPSVATITSGGQLTFLTTGTATIQADQAGNSAYLAATSVTQSFTVSAVAPGAPTIGTAAAGNAQASVTFTAPAFTGGATVTGYTVTANPGGATATGTSSPITVTGLTNGTSYTFAVAATNSAGTGSASASSNAVTPMAPPVISSALTASGTYGSAFSYTITASSSPTSYSATGLPAGLSLDTATGAITGTPTTSGSFNVTIGATNVGGSDSQTLVLSIARATVTVTGITAADKTYDGTTTATLNVTGAALVGVLGGDTANVTLDTSSASGAFADATAGALKTVTISGLALSGSAIANYSVTPPTATASILLAFPISENFDGKTNTDVATDGWLLSGNATVTSDHLQLTAAINAQSGAAIYNVPFSSSTGINVQFDYYMGGGTHADGLSVFLLDGAQAVPNAGGYGGALGYAYAGSGMGASKAYLGLGFDRFGNWANSTFFSLATGGASAAVLPNTIAIRGPATATNSASANGEYKYVAGSLVNYSVEGSQKVNLTISPAGHVTLRVSSDAGATWTTIYNDVDVAGSAAFAGYTQPSTLKLGFAASTGGQNNQHTIDNILVRKPTDLSVSFSSVPSGTQSVGATVLYQVAVTNTGLNGDPAAVFSYNVPTGISNVTWSYAITGTGSGAGNGTGNTINPPLNLPVGATATFTVSGTVASSAAGVTLAHTATITPSSAFGDTNVADNTATTTTTVYAAPVISSATTASGTYGSAFSYTITANAVPTSYSATGLPTGLTVDTTTGVISGTPTQAGSFTVSLGATNASGTGNASLALTVSPVALTVTADAQTKTYGDTDPALTYAVTSGTLISGDAFTGALARAAGEAVGTYAIGQGTLSAGNNYTITYVGANLTIGTRTVTPVVTISDKPYDSTTAATIASRSLTGVLGSDDVALTGGTAAFASATSGTVAVSVTGLSLTGTAASNYVLSSTSATATATIAKLPQTITFNSIGNVLIGDGVTLSATASTALPVTFSVVSGSAQVSGNTLVVNSAGSVTIRASQAGDANHNAAAADQTITASRQTQTITFGAIADHRASDEAFTLTATASSGLPVSFTIVSGPALLTGAKLSFSGAPGAVTVRASQAGSAAYEAAADVDQTFTVAAVGPLVYFGSIGGNPIAATTTPDSTSGTLIGIIPSTGEAFVVNFTPGSDGTWKASTTTYPTSSSTTSALPSPNGSHRIAAAIATGATRVFHGQVSGGTVTGSVDGLDLTFSAQLQPPVGPTAAIAGYYESSSLQTATGTIYTMVGTEGAVYALVISPHYVGGSTGTTDAAGQFTAAPGADVTLTGSVNSATTEVNGTLSLPQKPDEPFAGLSTGTVRTDRLLNLSSRGKIAKGSELITGFVVGGPDAKTVLLRAIGPSLGNYGVSSPLPTARLRLYDANGAVLKDVTGWSGDATVGTTMARVGAFALNAGNGDSATVVTLQPGVYTMHVLPVPDANGVTSSGIALAEIYDASANPSAEYQRLVNISSRGHIQSGDDVLIGGFVVNGNAPKRVLIRGAGPTLGKYGVTSPLADPTLTIYSGSTVLAKNDNWEIPVAVSADQTAATAQMISTAEQQVSAFPFDAGSHDAAVIVTLAPGTYTALVGSADGKPGTGLIEVYELPPQ